MCIIKNPEKVRIEQKNGEFKETLRAIHKYKLINCDISESRGRLAINSLTEKFDNPQREAGFLQKKIYAEAKRWSEEELKELKAAQ